MNQNHEVISETLSCQRLKKQWVEAKNRGGHYTQKANNAMIELAFTSVLQKAKQIFAQKQHTFVERDQRYDNTQNAFVMHSYIGNGFFFELSCNICCNYQVEYAFGNCRIENEVRHLLQVYQQRIILNYALKTAPKLRQKDSTTPIFRLKLINEITTKLLTKHYAETQIPLKSNKKAHFR